MPIIRVFPRKTSATPDDDMAFVGEPPLFRPDADEVHVSCAFTWDKGRAEHLANCWGQYYPVKVGGPAYGSPAGEFEPGMYVKAGRTITSRGCIRKCGFCFVPKREGDLRLLEIKPGYEILDNNLLACPRHHIEAVLDMLETQKQPAELTGGIDARLCEPWFAERLGKMRVKILYTAYDHPSHKASVERAIRMLSDAGLRQRVIGCYVLVGYRGDTLEAARERLEWVFGIGGTPYAMYYRDENGKDTRTSEWVKLVRGWIRPAAIFARKAPDGAERKTK